MGSRWQHVMHVLYYTAFVMGMCSPITTQVPSILPSPLFEINHITITLYRHARCPYADRIMEAYFKTVDVYPYYSWWIERSFSQFPSPTLRINLGEFSTNYYGENEVKEALNTHFIFIEFHSNQPFNLIK